MNKNTKRILLLVLYLFPFMLHLGIIDFMIPIKYDIILDQLPLMGLLVTIALLGSTFLDFAIGDLTDRIGIRKTLQIGVIFGFAGALLFGLSQDIIIMTFGIFLYGVGYVMFTIPSDTYIFSAFPKNYRGSAYGYLYSFFALAYAIAPLLSYVVISLFGIDHIIVAAAMIILIVFPASYALKGKQKESIKKAIDGVIVKDGFILKELKDIKKMNFKEISLLINCFVCGLWFIAIMLGAPLLFFHEAHNLLQGAILTASFMLPFAILDFFLGNVANSHKRRLWMTNLGFLFTSLFLILFFFIDNFYVMIILAALIAISADMAWTASEVHISEFLPDGRKGEFMGIFDTGKDLGFDLAPLFYGVFAAISLKFPFLALGLLFLVAGIIFFIASLKK